VQSDDEALRKRRLVWRVRSGRRSVLRRHRLRGAELLRQGRMRRSPREMLERVHVPERLVRLRRTESGLLHWVDVQRRRLLRRCGRPLPRSTDVLRELEQHLSEQDLRQRLRKVQRRLLPRRPAVLLRVRLLERRLQLRPRS
jgi:hypothetical protein